MGCGGKCWGVIKCSREWWSVVERRGSGEL